MAGLEAFHSTKFASACEFHLDEYLDEVAKEDDDRRELCDGDLREDGDKLKSQLKDFVNFIPGKIVETSNHSWGTLIHAENYKDAPDNVIEKKIWPHDDEGNYYCSVRVYRLSYLAIDDRGTEYMITMEYIKSNEANPEEIGLNYVSIFKTDPDSDEIIRAGRTWE